LARVEFSPSLLTLSPHSSKHARWFAEEVQPHESSLRSYLRHTFPSLSDVDDVVQESHARLLRAHDAGRITYAKAFLFTTARNAALDFFRRRKLVTIETVGDLSGLTVYDDAPDAAAIVNRQQGLGLELRRERAPATKPLVHAGWRDVVPTLDASAPTVEPVSATAMRAALAWHGARRAFVDLPLSEVVEQFNRRNTMQLALADTELGSMSVGGSFDADNVEAFVRLLASNDDLAVERPAPDRIVLRNVSHLAKRAVTSNNNAVVYGFIPGFTVVDLSLSFERGANRCALNVDNLFHTEYEAAVRNESIVVPGKGTNVKFSVARNFWRDHGQTASRPEPQALAGSHDPHPLR